MDQQIRQAEQELIKLQARLNATLGNPHIPMEDLRKLGRKEIAVRRALEALYKELHCKDRGRRNSA